MACIVGGFCLPHVPLIAGAPDAVPVEKAKRVHAGFTHIRNSIERLNADAVIVVGDDHCAMFNPSCQPSILIGIGDLEGPIESWLHIPREPVPNHSELAEHIMSFGFESGFDWGVAKTLALDHSTVIPIHFAVPKGLPVVPIYISSGMEPFIRGKRCKQLGEMLGRAVSAWPGAERIVILGTGGISHWVGMADMGSVNEEFDRRILGLVNNNDVDALVSLTDREIIDHAGNGALEVRNWIVAMAALPQAIPRLILYEPVVEWITGLGFVELEVAA
ncbi:MAG: protocatechuate 3,4-dioxygenase [Burkholderiaceae bacterium]|nr:MAG: protocatechuate 3,4-dioxygenase [Burkholderiaceae bacterium]TAM02123.1 MAG: protocatechuate 3,4-dioxygenase [Pusillimonas sp.]